MSEVHKQVSLDGGRTFSVRLGSIVDEDVDAIVNAANSRLEHGGGVAAVIADAGGRELRQASRELVQNEGEVPVGGAATTTAGELPHRGVIHAVGPRQGEDAEKEKLVSAVATSLRRADEEGWTSLAFPAISAGIFGVPPDTCAASYVDGVRLHFEEYPGSSVTDVRLCLFEPDPDLLEAVDEALDGAF
ncbi:MAG: macro domain-containing protein [Longimicrobiales bacterium]|nr:macro domain-containing protein [Longimicrobiales bacterium]